MTDYSRWLLGTGACLTLWWFGFTPQWLVLKIWRSIAAVLGIFLGPVVALLRGSPDGEELLTLRASMRNITRDYDQVGSLAPRYNVVLSQVCRATVSPWADELLVVCWLGQSLVWEALLRPSGSRYTVAQGPAMHSAASHWS